MWARDLGQVGPDSYMFERGEMEAWYVTGTQQWVWCLKKTGDADDVFEAWKIPGVTVKVAPEPHTIDLMDPDSFSTSATSGTSGKVRSVMVKEFEYGIPERMPMGAWWHIGEYTIESGIFYNQGGQARKNQNKQQKPLHKKTWGRTSAWCSTAQSQPATRHPTRKGT